jgi:hypothetical protein
MINSAECGSGVPGLRCASSRLRCLQKLCYAALMTKALKDILQIAETWPVEAQKELAHIAREIDAAVKGERYFASEEELRAIDDARAAVQRGEVVSEDKARAVLAKYRGA